MSTRAMWHSAFAGSGRPELPATTPVTNGSNSNTLRSNPYATVTQPHFEKDPSLSKLPSNAWQVNSSPVNANGNSNDSFGAAINRNNSSYNSSQKIFSRPASANFIDTREVRRGSKEEYEKILQKLIASLSYSDRETVLQLFRGQVQFRENDTLKMEEMYKEYLKMKLELDRRVAEIEGKDKSLDIFRENNRNLKDSLDSMKDQFDIQQKFTIRNKRVVARLSHTNRILIDSLEALGVSNEELNVPQTAEKVPRKGLLRPMSYNNIPDQPNNSQSPPGGRGGVSPDENGPALPLHTESSAGVLATTHTASSLEMEISKMDPQLQQQMQALIEMQMKFKNPTDANDTTNKVSRPGTVDKSGAVGRSDTDQKLKDKQIKEGYQFEKIRNTLLRLTRDHYKAVNLADALELKNVKLEANMKILQKTNKNLNLELNELKRKLDIEITDERPKIDSSEGNFGHVAKFDETERIIRSLLNRSHLDTVDQYLQLRRVMYHIIDIPNSISLPSVCNHMVSKDIAKILQVEMVILYLLPDKDRKTIHKYSMRSSKPEIISISSDFTEESLVLSVLRDGNILRYNNRANMHLFNQELDGIAGTLSKRVMFVPIKDRQTNITIGAFQLINKFSDFTDYDEYVAEILGNSFPFCFDACKMHKKAVNKGYLLCNLLQSSTAMFDVIPDPSSVSSNKILNTGEILHKLEQMVLDLLKCSKVAAFIVSDWVSTGNESGMLYKLDKGRGKAPPSVAGLTINTFKVQTVPLTGLVGLVVQSRSSHELSSGIPGSSDLLNPTVDLEPSPGEIMLTVPIMNLSGSIIACIQVVPGYSSPKLRLDVDDPIDEVTFYDAIHWLVHQVRGSLQYLTLQVGKSSVRPVSTPKPVASRGNIIIPNSRSPSLNDKTPRSLSHSHSLPTGHSPRDTILIEPLSNPFIDHPVYKSSLNTIPSASNAANVDNYSSEQIKERDFQIASLKEKLTELSTSLHDTKSKLSHTSEELDKNKNDILGLKTDINDRIKLENTMLEEKRLLENMNTKYAMEVELLTKQIEHAHALENKLLKNHNNMNISDFNNSHQVQLDEIKQTYGLRIELLEGELKETKLRSKEFNESCLVMIHENNQKLEKAQTSADNLKAKNHELESQLAQKEYVIKIMQEQLVKMASQSLQEINAAMVGGTLDNPSTEEAFDHVPGAGGASEPLRVGDWDQSFDELGNEYWVNSISGESVWELPHNVSLASRSFSTMRDELSNVGGPSGGKVYGSSTYSIEL